MRPIYLLMEIQIEKILVDLRLRNMVYYQLNENNILRYNIILKDIATVNHLGQIIQ